MSTNLSSRNVSAAQRLSKSVCSRAVSGFNRALFTDRRWRNGNREANLKNKDGMEIFCYASYITAQIPEFGFTDSYFLRCD